MLQVGGVQEAITLAPPALVVDTTPELLTATLAGCDELQVKGTPVMVFPRASTTVGVTVFPPPEVRLMELVLLPVMASVIDRTAQVLKSRDWLFTLLTLANKEVTPGVSAFACSWPGKSPLTGALALAMLSVATPGVNACQLNGPTLAVTSRPRLKAVA
jgi:hypothetical protein